MKALWAFEPFHQDKARIKGMYDTLCEITGSASNVEVGFVVTRTESTLSLAFDIPEKDRFTNYPKDLIRQELKKARIKMDDRKIHVVECPTTSSTKAVDELLKLGRSRNAKLIGLFTHAKKGYFRLALGSFAETAIHRSKVSLLICSPNTKVSSKIKNILVASDFGSSSKNQLKTAIEQSKKVRAKLIVFHHADPIYSYSFDETSPNVRSYRKSVNRMKAWIEQECKSAKVSVDVIIANEFRPTAELILKTAKKRNANLVVVSAKVGPLAALMGGSITRQVVRASKVPVLVLK